MNRSKLTFVLFTAFLLAFSPIALSPVFAQGADAVAEREAQLKAELEIITQEIAAQQAILKGKQRESVSLERDIAILNAEIAEAKLGIRARNIILERLNKDIGVKNETIEVLNVRIEKSEESLADLIRKTNEIDDYSLTEIMLINQDLSEFFADFDAYSFIKESLRSSYVTVTEAKESTETEKLSLEEKRKAEADAKAEIEVKKRQIEKSEAQKKKLLTVTKSEEKNYQLVLKEQEKRAAQIRTALFSLRDTAAIPFGTALAYANEAFERTGVRPAFLLAILTQETNLGENVGTCNRPQDPPEKGWRVIMKPERDHAPYLEVTSELGLNPDTMPLSCPWQNGWGGAMGPSQFIPSTWKAYKARVAAALGKSTANPWLPEDAFMASSLYLKDLGAAKGGYSAEREAALRYYAGGAWNKPANAFYGREVLAKATNIQENMIDPLENF